eukprot:s29_g25.t1
MSVSLEMCYFFLGLHPVNQKHPETIFGRFSSRSFQHHDESFATLTFRFHHDAMASAASAEGKSTQM